MSASEASGSSREGMLAVTRPSPLRLAGFLATIIGAGMLGIGAVMTWLEVPPPPDVGGNVGLTYVGLDLAGGKCAVIAAIVLLVGLMALRGARTDGGRKAVASVMVLGALLGLVGAWYVLLRASSYALPDAPTVTKSLGLYLAAVGGIVAVVGAGLDLAWAVAPAAEGSEASEPTIDTEGT
jgi:hypothetical protein